MTAWRAGSAILLAIRQGGRLFCQREAFLKAYRAPLQLRVLRFALLQDVFMPLSQSTASWRMHGSGPTSGKDLSQSFRSLCSRVKYVRNV